MKMEVAMKGMMVWQPGINIQEIDFAMDEAEM